MCPLLVDARTLLKGNIMSFLIEAAITQQCGDKDVYISINCNKQTLIKRTNTHNYKHLKINTI